MRIRNGFNIVELLVATTIVAICLALSVVIIERNQGHSASSRQPLGGWATGALVAATVLGGVVLRGVELSVSRERQAMRASGQSPTFRRTIALARRAVPAELRGLAIVGGSLVFLAWGSCLAGLASHRLLFPMVSAALPPLPPFTWELLIGLGAGTYGLLAVIEGRIIADLEPEILSCAREVGIPLEASQKISSSPSVGATEDEIVDCLRGHYGYIWTPIFVKLRLVRRALAGLVKDGPLKFDGIRYGY